MPVWRKLRREMLVLLIIREPCTHKCSAMQDQQKKNMYSPERQNNYANEAKRLDYDRYLSSFFMPKLHQAAFRALIVFYHEMARIPVIASEPLIGMMRLTWWREGIEAFLVDAPPGKPNELLRDVGTAWMFWPKIHPLLLAMIEARTEELDADALNEEEAWHRHIDATAGNMLRMYALLCDAEMDTGSEEITSLARAQAYVGLARAIPNMARENTMRLPASYVQAAGLSYQPSAFSAPSKGVTQCVSALSYAAEKILATRPKVECLRGIHLIVQARNKQLQKASFNPYDERLAITPIALYLKLLRYSIIG